MSSSFAIARKTSSHSVHKSKAKGRSLSFTTTREESLSRSRRLSSSFNIEVYLKDEYFNINPKTDYTYAYSGSYCRSKPDKDVVSPNMSRRKLRSRTSMSSEMTRTHMSEVQTLSPVEQSELLTPSHMDQSEENLLDVTDEMDFSDSYLVDRRLSGYQVAHGREGMVLRSGSHLHRVSSVIREHELHNWDSNKSFSTSVVNQSKNMYNRNQNQKHTMYDLNENRGSSVSKSSVGSTVSSVSSSVASVRRTLQKQFEEEGSIEKGDFEESEKMGVDRSQNSRTPTSVISHMLGGMYDQWKRFTQTEMSTYRSGVDTITDIYLTESAEPKSFIDVATNTDSTESFSDYSVSGSSHADDYSFNYKCENLTASPGILKSTPAVGQSWMQRLTHSNTTTTRGLDEEDEFSDFESVSAAESKLRFHQRDRWRKARNIFTSIYISILVFLGAVWDRIAPVWYRIAPVWHRIAPVWHRTGARAYEFVKKIVFFFITFDVWFLARRNRNRACLCLLLPLLLLLIPLWSCASFDHDLFSFPFLGSKSTLWMNDNVASQYSGFDEKVKQIIVQLQRNQGPQLTAMDIERIMKGVISEELYSMKTDFSQQINDVKGNMASWQIDQKLKYLSLEERIAASLNMSEQLEKKMREAMAAASMGGKQDVQMTREKIRLLEEQIQVLSADISNLRLSQLEMLAGVKNCCHNDTFFAAVIKSQVNDILTQIMTGGDHGGETGTEFYGGFKSWLNTNYVKKGDWDKNLADLKSEITNRLVQITKEHNSQKIYLQSEGAKDSGLSEEYVRFIVDEAILKFSADKTGMADYALESVGGSVISIRCSVTYYKKTALVSIFGIPLWYASNSPRTVIQPDVHPGQCWAFKGKHGYLVIQLATAVQPTGFTLEHISKLLSPAGNVDSAPKDFAVFGLKNEHDMIGTPLGNYSYSQDRNPVQFFPIQATRVDYFKIVELKIFNNHGNPEYTCLYRFRVHGVPYKTYKKWT